MKDINKEEISDFEKNWQKAFENAEMPLEDDIWSNINAQLANKEAEKYKRKIIFYKWVAAASIVFAVALSYFSYHINLSDPLLVTVESLDKPSSINPEDEFSRETLLSLEDSFNTNKEETKEDILNKPPLAKANTNEKNAIENNAVAQLEAQNLSKNRQSLLEDNISSGNASAVFDNKKGQTKSPTVIADANHITPLETKNLRQVSFQSNQEVAPVAFIDTKTSKPFDLKYHAQLLDPPYIYAIPGISIKREKKDDNEKEILWAGFNIGSGVFNPNFENGSNFQPKVSPALSQTYAREAPQAAAFKENTNAGITYSLGVNFGVRLTPKWVVQSGIQYAHKSASTNSTTVLQNNIDEKMKPTYLGEENSVLTTSNATFIQEYDLLNSFEFASIPLKAGYLLIDRKVGLMLTAGIGADIFLSNTISESNDKLDEVKMEAGSSSPFREVNFNGLLGAEVFYQFSRQYHLTLEPNYSIALNPFTKTNETFKSHPQAFGITAGLKYYWK